MWKEKYPIYAPYLTNQFTGIQETWLILQMLEKKIFGVFPRLFERLMENIINILNIFFFFQLLF